MDTGTIGEYCWAQIGREQGELSIADVILRLHNYVIGLRAVNVSWDSGRLTPSQEQLASGWRMQNGYAITPKIDSPFIEFWPMNSCAAFDEWYFFRGVPPEIRLEAFCNWGVGAVSDWGSLVECQPNNINLLNQLRQHEPELVVGEGHFVFVIAKDPKAIEALRGLTSEP